MRKNKYFNHKCVINNIVFDSKKEARRYEELRLLEKANIISQLKLQPRYILQESFKYKGKTERAITYIADFEYIDLERNKKVIEDVKGMKTEVYKIKRKLLLKQISNDEYIEFKEV